MGFEHGHGVRQDFIKASPLPLIYICAVVICVVKNKTQRRQPRIFLNRRSGYETRRAQGVRRRGSEGLSLG